MSGITLLSEDVINKIAAGEVIERPASVIKELIENSLDAHATSITVELKNVGKDLICIQDNGEGMDEQDARNSFLRHATSKIRTADDLFNISTLGFRGEALASIAAVSECSLITKTASSLEGFHLEIKGGKISKETITAADQGTIVEVKNLFFNTPARKKFLKTDPVELRHCIDIVTRYALIHHHVAFKLVHNAQELINAPATKDQRQKIAFLYSPSLAKDLLEINYKDTNATITGFICKPYNARNDKTQQLFFINKRGIKNDDLTKTVYNAYHSILFVNKHPIFFLHLILNPATIDVNVHPQKSEIKIEQKEAVQQSLFKALRTGLAEHNLLPDVDISIEQQFLPPKPVKYAFEKSQQTILVKEQPIQFTKEEYLRSESSPEYTIPKNTSPFISSKLPPLKLLGQIHKTFFVAETLGGVVFIDQHAAHERILYEQFMEGYHQQHVQVQHLLQAELIDLSVSQSLMIQEHQQLLKECGFHLEPFRGNTFSVKTIPSVFGRTQPKELLLAVLESLQEKSSSLERTREIIITRMACRAAVMAGEELTAIAMDKILQELEATDLPFTCPHGRPTLIKTSVDELEKKFRRKS